MQADRTNRDAAKSGRVDFVHPMATVSDQLRPPVLPTLQRSPDARPTPAYNLAPDRPVRHPGASCSRTNLLLQNQSGRHRTRLDVHNAHPDPANGGLFSSPGDITARAG
ncbi:hypothetical protein FRACA_580003 [Frankia canadensis]|uniref:Uncharacterized protein n=1 Tax=Frankia canadensis TaxID=1836972 RepID=A0A2I2KZ51_9ACTN|nr:hypothetical protein FRACA_580003 [Frankia canadensis]SOU58242.1 hypothetical protein FRACA_580003 [Frankia canadensis]